jgi:hypothetical protein
MCWDRRYNDKVDVEEYPRFVFGSIVRKWHSRPSTWSTGTQSASSSFQSGSKRPRPHFPEHNSPSLLAAQYSHAPCTVQSLAPPRALRECYRHCSGVCRSSTDRHSGHPGREMQRGLWVSMTRQLLVVHGSARARAWVLVASNLAQAHIDQAFPARGTLGGQGQAS